ncbi:hypothetical protein M0R01_03755 [bacterium]|nr:hypothetical protein [bacterium]
MKRKLRICLLQPGGCGDSIMVEPIARWIKDNNDNTEIAFAARPEYMKVMMNNPYFKVIDGFEILKAIKNHDSGILNQFDIPPINFATAINTNPDAEKMHYIDAHYKYIDQDIDTNSIPIEYKIPRLFIKEDRAKLAKSWFNVMELRDRITVGIQIRSSSYVRNWNKNKELALLLGSNGYNVILFSNNPYDFFSGPNIYTPPFKYTHQQMENVVAFANECDILVSPDSSFVQIAQALNKKLVCMYGPFPSEYRVKYYDNVIAIENHDHEKFKCMPCYLHHHTCPFGSTSPCMDSISVDDVFDAIVKKSHEYGMDTGKLVNTEFYSEKIYSSIKCIDGNNFAIMSPNYGVWTCENAQEIANRIKTHTQGAYPNMSQFCIADMGCGDGALMDAISKCSRDKFYPLLYGIDIMDSAKHQARVNHHDIWSNIKKADIRERFIWSNGKLNCIIYNEILEHMDIYGAIEAIKTGKSYLHNKGIMYILYSMEHAKFDMHKVFGMIGMEIVSNSMIDNKTELIARKIQNETNTSNIQQSNSKENQ